MRAEPLLQLYPHFRLNGRGPGAWRDAAYQLQPVLTILVQIRLALDVRFRAQRQKEIGRSAAQSVAEETRRSDSHYRKGLLIDIERAVSYRQIGPISFLPQPITHHGDWRRAGLIVPGSKGASGIRTESEHREVIAGNEL